MTLSSTTVKDDYSGDGSTTDFATTFVFWNSSELKVIHTSTGGTETTWTEGTQYDVTGGAGATGTVSASTTGTDYTPDSGETLRIKSNVLDIQETALPAGGAFPSTSVEQELDRMVRRVQQQEEQFGRSPLLSEGSTFSGLTLPDPSADLVLGWNSSGDELSNLTPNSSAYIDTSDYLATANNLSDVADAATSLSNIGGIGAATSDTLTNKTIDADGTGNVITNIGSSEVKSELISGQTEAVIAAGDSILWGDADDSGNLKRDTVQGLLDLVSADVVLLETTTIGAAVATVELTAFDNSTYTSYFIVCGGITVTTDNDDFFIRTSTDGGSTFDSGASDYMYQFSEYDGTSDTQAGSDSASSILFSSQNIGNASGESCSMIIEIMNPADASEYCDIHYRGMMENGAGNRKSFDGGGRRQDAGDVDAISVNVTGTMDAGTFKLYGRK